MEQTKLCKKCMEIMPLSAFYKHAQMSDGYFNKCKECIKKEAKIRYQDPSEAEYQRKRGREKYRRLYKGVSQGDSDEKKRYMSEYKRKYPEKSTARGKTFRMNRKEGHHLHHWSYNAIHGRDVIELSIKDHAKAHRFLVYDQERMMYRNLEGVLLDTRERHETYIRHMIEVMED
jgi:hypothetical protein